MDTGLLLLRLVVGLLFIGHGAQKLFGWFGGPGRAGATRFVATLGYRPARPLALGLGMAEASAGCLLVLGLATPIAATLIGAVMMNAIVSVHWSKGIWNEKGGYEFPLTLWTGALTLAFVGAGRYSLDYAIAWDMAGLVPGFAALATGVLLGGVALALRPHEAATAAEREQRRAA